MLSINSWKKFNGVKHLQFKDDFSLFSFMLTN